jgi:phosphohistidine phosphatase
MNLFILRHGNAESAAPRDSERPLSIAGRAEVHSIISRYSDDLAEVDCVLVSPFLRAQQTCAIARQYLPQISDLQQHTVDFLTPSAAPQAVIDWVFATQYKSVLMVSHQPLLGTVLDQLCNFEPGRYRMGTAALAKICVAEPVRGLAELVWLQQP